MVLIHDPNICDLARYARLSPNWVVCALCWWLATPENLETHPKPWSTQIPSKHPKPSSFILSNETERESLLTNVRVRRLYWPTRGRPPEQGSTLIISLMNLKWYPIIGWVVYLFYRLKFSNSIVTFHGGHKNMACHFCGIRHQYLFLNLVSNVYINLSELWIE